MKQIILLLVFCILALSCSTDELVLKNGAQDSINGNINLTENLFRVAQYPAALDNVIDNTSCFSIQFPYSVIVNDQTLVIDSVDDYQTVRTIVDEDNGFEDYVAIQFPVTAVYADYSEAVFTTQGQLDAAVADCTASIELSCMDFVYPLGIKAYNSQNQLAEQFNLGSKKGLYGLLEDMNFYDTVTFDYPIGFTAPDGSSITINTTFELEETIAAHVADCLALIDSTPGPGPQPEPGTEFEDVLQEGSWHVSYFFRDNDQTEDYEDFNFTFNSNGTVTITGVNSPGTGTWTNYTDSGDLIAEFTFTNNDLEELEEDWTVIEFSSTLIKMEHVSGGGEDIRSFFLTKN